MHQLLAYIKFLATSTNQHGVHSPFVYNLVTKCFYDTSQYAEYNTLASYRKQLQQSKKTITITDFGAGSKQLSSNRKVSDMVAISSSNFKKTKLLFRLSRYFKFTETLELGTHLGIGTQALALGHPNGKVTSIEGCTNTYAFTKSQLNAQNVTLLNATFSEAIPQLKQQKFDCIFFDGHHTKKATLHYFNALLDKVHNDSVFIFDDIYWSKNMTDTWQNICQNSKVTVSIDTYHLGFVFFRKEQPKQHFKIRV